MKENTIVAGYNATSEVEISVGKYKTSESSSTGVPIETSDTVEIAVVGAHLSGMALNKELQHFGAQLVRQTTTGPDYKFFALKGTSPPKPGLLRVNEGCGTEIIVEVWRISLIGFGRFVAAIPPPLSIGTIKLSDGWLVKGFLVEAIATVDASDISHYGGWRAYSAAQT